MTPKLESALSGLQKQDEELEVSSGSFIEFYKNGKLQARKDFSNIYEGTYHAGVSMYMNASCRVNFGKSQFRYQPSSEHRRGSKWLPYSMLADVDCQVSTHQRNLEMSGGGA